MKPSINWNKRTITYKFDYKEDMELFLSKQKIIEINKKRNESIAVYEGQNNSGPAYTPKES